MAYRWGKIEYDTVLWSEIVEMGNKMGILFLILKIKDFKIRLCIYYSVFILYNSQQYQSNIKPKPAQFSFSVNTFQTIHPMCLYFTFL